MLAVPTRAALAGVAMRLAGDEPRWGRAEDALAHLDPLQADTRDHAIRLGFESMSAAWIRSSPSATNSPSLSRQRRPASLRTSLSASLCGLVMGT